MLKTIIIENNTNDSNLISTIQEYIHEVKIVGEADSVDNAIKTIAECQPDLVFLDAHIDSDNGFHFLDSFTERPFLLIITSINEKHAIKAFEYDAIDYIIKPYNPQKIKSGIKKVLNIKELLSKINLNSKVSLRTDNGINIIDYNEIIYASSDKPYSKLHMANGPCILISKTIKQLESTLPKSQFFRLHSSYLINLNKLQRYAKEDGGYVVMTCGTSIPLARRRKVDFLNLISKKSTLGI
jgi:two-component system LytT family response regulator